MAGAVSFAGVAAEPGQKSPVRYSILPVPFDLTASYVKGASRGPAAIIEASTHMELYDEELGCEPYKAGIETLSAIEPRDDPADMIAVVQGAAREVLSRGTIPVLLGGEHSVTLGMVRALMDQYSALSVLQLDAHADMRDSYESSPYNHACVARRISELCPLVQAGVRSLSVEEAGFLKAGRATGSAGAGIKTYYAAGIKGMGADLLARIVEDLTQEVFITIDLDVFDPSIMPATGTPEPGGLGWYEVLGLLRAVASKRKVVGFDLVELCPQPGNVAPDFMAARLVYKMIAYIEAGKRA
jgi:agmatinase